MKNVLISEIYRLAKEYKNYGTGSKWEVLYDYIIETGPSNVFTTANITKFVELMSAYLGQFNMKMYGKTGLTTDRLNKVFTEGSSILSQYLISPSALTLIKAWKSLYILLPKNQITNSHVMISKILMGLGGKTPAFDSYVTNTLVSNPLLPQIGINGLIKMLEEGGFEPLKTEKGNIIPWERMCDMALWWAWYNGPEDLWLVSEYDE
jgi:hypothetical protein